MLKKTRLLISFICLLAGSQFSQLLAGELFVSAADKFGEIIDSAKPGDTVIIKNGGWKDIKLTVNRGGASGKPLIIRAETPGGAVFSGASSLELNAPFVTVDGLFFWKGALKKGSVIQFNSENDIVRNTAVVDYNPESFETKYHWVYFNGNNNLVEHCFFKGKNHLQPLVANAQKSSRHNAVKSSYFKDIPYAKANGRSVFTVFGYGHDRETGDDGAFFVIEGNLFENAHGEGNEIICLKSGHNLVARNTILSTMGGIDIRSGDFNTIEENVILGGGVERSYGVRIDGNHQIVKNNLISGCEFGLKIECGEYIEAALTPEYEAKAPHPGSDIELGRIALYPQTKFLVLSGNFLTGNMNYDLEVGSNYKKHWPRAQNVLLPEECEIAGNMFAREKGGVSVTGTAPDASAPLDRFKFKPNLYAGNLLLGGKNDFPAAAAGFKRLEYSKELPGAPEAAKLKALEPAEVCPPWVLAKGF